MLAISNILIVKSFAQFPFLGGKESSGTIASLGVENKENRSILSFEVSKTKFNYIREISFERESEDDYSNYWIGRLEIGGAFNDKKFEVFDKKFRPGFDLAFNIVEHTWVPLSDSKKYRLFTFKPIIETNMISYHTSINSFGNTTYSKESDWKFDIGINTGYAFVKLDNDIGITSSLSFSLYSGISSNNIDDLKSVEICEVVSEGILDTKNVIVNSCSNSSLGLPEMKSIIKPKIDYAIILGQPFKGDNKKPRFSNKAIYLLARVSAESIIDDKTKYQSFLGFSLTNTDGVATGAILFGINDLKKFNDIGTPFEDIFTISIHFGVPL